jgi:ABC-2 type transport system permease protein
MAAPGFTRSALSLTGYRIREFFNLFKFGGYQVMLFGALITVLGLAFIWFDYVFFSRLIAAILEKLEFMAPFMLHQLVHTLFISFFGLLVLSSLSSSISGFYMSREIPFLISSPVSPTAFIGQRLMLVYFQSAWMILIFGAPPFFAYAKRLGLGNGFLTWWFPVFILLVSIPVLLGCILGMLLMKVLPASRVSQAVSFISLAIAAMIIILFRMSRPERLFMDVPQEEVMGFVKAMTVPENPLLPTSWATSAVMSLSGGQPEAIYWNNLIYLAAGTAVLAGIFLLVFRLYYFGSLASVDEGRQRSGRKGETLIERLFKNRDRITGSYLIKDLLLFIRDPARWTQLFLLGALVVLYIYNAYSFPLGGMFYRNLVAFLNLAISGFVLSALCVRFVFPSVSLEGRALWMTMAAPVSMNRFFWAKYLFAAVPLVIVSVVLSVSTNLVMGVSPDALILFTGASVAMALALTGLNLGMGAVYPRFDYDNEAQIPASAGGVATMIISLAYIAGMVVSLASPVYRLFAQRLGLAALTRGDALLGIFIAGVLTFVVATVPMGWGLRRVGDWASLK